MNIWKKFIGLFKTVEVETTHQPEKLDEPISEVEINHEEIEPTDSNLKNSEVKTKQISEEVISNEETNKVITPKKKKKVSKSDKPSDK